MARKRGNGDAPAKVKPDRGEFRGIFVALIDSEEFQALPADARSIFWPIKLLLGQAGIAVFYPEVLPRYTGISSERVSNGLKALCTDDWIRVHANVYWLRNGLLHDPSQPLKSPNQRRSIEQHLKTLPKLALVNEFARYYELEIPFPDLKGSAKGSGKGSARDTEARNTEDGVTDEEIRSTEDAVDARSSSSSVDVEISSTPPSVHDKDDSSGGGAGPYTPIVDNSDLAPSDAMMVAATASINTLAEAFVARLAGWPQPKIRRFMPQVGPLLNGLDRTAWKDKNGDDAPWHLRPWLFELALSRWEAEPDVKLRSHVSYVVKEQLTPQQQTNNGNNGGKDPEPVRRAGKSDLERVTQGDRKDDPAADSKVDAWIQEHPDEAVRLRLEASAEIAEDPKFSSMPQTEFTAVTIRGVVRSRYMAKVRAAVLAEKGQEDTTP